MIVNYFKISSGLTTLLLVWIKCRGCLIASFVLVPQTINKSHRI